MALTSPPIHRSAVCPPETNLTAPHRLPHLSVRPSTYPPVLPSFPGSADSSISPPFSSVRLSGCLSRPGCVDSSSVSCRRSVLLRHGHWSDACTLSADGQATVPSRARHRLPRPHLKFFPLCSKVYFAESLSLAAALGLFSCDLFPSPPPPPFMADHLVAGKLTERKSGRGRQIGNIQSPPLKSCAQKVCQPSPEQPRASQSILPLLFMSPMPRLHLDSIPACDEVPSYMDKTAHDFRKTARGARRFHFNYISTPCMILLESQNETDKQISTQAGCKT